MRSPTEPDLFAPAPVPEAPAPAPVALASAPVLFTGGDIGPGDIVACPHFTLLEDDDASYVPRTRKNAAADATWAYAVDFDTAGERLTASAAGPRLLQTTAGTSSEDAARALIAHLGRLQARSLNVAGNGIYTLVRHFPKLQPAALQARVDAFVLRVLAMVHAAHPLAQVRSGGQTGIDEAGIKAGIALGIPTLALLPKGYRFRNAIGEDRTMLYGAAWRRFIPNPERPDVF